MITLMYHGITSPDCPSPPCREAGAEFYDVSADNFRRQLQWIKVNDKNPVLTFDDGEMNNYRIALPILKEFGFKAVFFIIIKRIGQQGYMGWDELKGLIGEGMTIGSHGLTHEILTNLKETQIIEELRASKNCLERNLGLPVDSFSVPRGFCNGKIIDMAHEAGYRHIFISDRPNALKAPCIPRIAVKSRWSVGRLAQALENRVPAGEKAAGLVKNAAKSLLREAGYNFVRRTLICLGK